MSPRRLLVVARKEFHHIARDPRILFLVTIAPAFLLITLSYVFAMDVERVTLVVRDLDHTPLSRQLISHLTADGDFIVVARVQRNETLESLFTHGVADLVLTIPRGFAAQVQAGEGADLQAIIDGADAISASTTLGFLESRVQAFAVEQMGPAAAKRSAIVVKDRAWYNEALKSLVSMVPGLLAIILCMPALALALALVREKETGSFENIIATPVRGTEYLVGKLLAYEVSGLASAILAWMVATLWFSVPFRGRFIDYLVLTMVYMIASMGIALLVANFARSQQTAMFLMLMIFFVPSFFISGLISPVSEEPVTRAFAYALPPTHFIAISRSVFLKGLGPLALWRPASMLLGIGLVSQALSLRLFEKKIV
jgi:ABC-2 type transport system permease protein